MMVFEKENGGVKYVEIPTQAQEIYDVSGAGDTVSATIALCLSVGASLQEAAQIANIAAGIVVGKFGTSTVTMKEIKQRLS